MLKRLLRPLFIGMGLSLVMTGASLLFVDRITLKDVTQMSEARMPQVFVRMAPRAPHVLAPPAWVPMTALAVGGLTVLYSLALPKRAG